MMVVYAFIYYFLLGMIGLSFSLAIFAFKPTRRALHFIEKKSFALFHNPVIKYVIYLSFAVIALILFDSIANFITLNQHFAQNNTLLSESSLQKLDLITSPGGHGHSHHRQMESMLSSMKEYRQYYMSERNMMLSGSALFAFFIFNRLFFSIRRLADLQAQIQKGASSIYGKANQVLVPQKAQ